MERGELSVASRTGVFGPGHDDDPLVFRHVLAAFAARALCKSSASCRPARYTDGHPAPGRACCRDRGRPSAPSAAQYVAAIEAARRSIYIENQAFEVSEGSRPAPRRRPWVGASRSWCWCRSVPEERGARIFAHTPQGQAFAASTRGAWPPRALRAGRHPPGTDPSGGRHDVYVHGKIMLIDDCWATIGSCNLHAGSFGRQHRDERFVSGSRSWCAALRCDLFAEHFG